MYDCPNFRRCAYDTKSIRAGCEQCRSTFFLTENDFVPARCFEYQKTFRYLVHSQLVPGDATGSSPFLSFWRSDIVMLTKLYICMHSVNAHSGRLRSNHDHSRLNHRYVFWISVQSRGRWYVAAMSGLTQSALSEIAFLKTFRQTGGNPLLEHPHCVMQRFKSVE